MRGSATSGAWSCTIEVARDGPGITGLRVATYLLVSVASVLFIAVVVYGYVKLGQASSALDAVLDRPGVPSLPPPIPSSFAPIPSSGFSG